MNNKKQLCCDECGGDNIEFKVWADELDVVSGGLEDNETWCNDCQEHTESLFKKDYKQGVIK